MNTAIDQWTALWITQIWQITVVIAVVGVLTTLFCRRRPHLAGVLWCIVLVKCLTPPLWSGSYGAFTWALTRSAPSFTAKPVIESPSPSTAVAISVSEPGTEPVNTGDGGFDLSVAAGDIASANRGLRFDGKSVAGVLFVNWIAGIIVISAIVGIRALRGYRRLQRSTVPADDELAKRLEEMRVRLGIRRRVRLVVTSEPWGPAVFGLVRPTIILPAALTAARPALSLETILAHELLHVRRGDIFLSAVQLAAQVIWWFHPLVWWVNRRMVQAREQACDEEVVANLNVGCDGYAAALVDVLKLKGRLRAIPILPGVRSLEVTKNRLEHIMAPTLTPKSRVPRAYWVLLAVGLVIVLPGAGRKGPRTDKPPVGSGLLFQLPNEDVRVTYDMDLTVTRRGRPSPKIKGVGTIASVGTETIDAKKCRWIEVSMMTMDGENPTPTITRVLIPEEELSPPKDPLPKTIKAWTASRPNDPPKEIPLPLKPSGSLPHGNLSPELKNVKWIEPKTIKTGIGELECDGVSGSYEFKERGLDMGMEYEIYLHDSAPFGVAAMRMRPITKQNGAVVREGDVFLTLKSVEKNAKPAFEIPAARESTDAQPNK